MLYKMYIVCIISCIHVATLSGVSGVGSAVWVGGTMIYLGDWGHRPSLERAQCVHFHNYLNNYFTSVVLSDFRIFFDQVRYHRLKKIFSLNITPYVHWGTHRVNTKHLKTRSYTINVLIYVVKKIKLKKSVRGWWENLWWVGVLGYRVNSLLYSVNFLFAFFFFSYWYWVYWITFWKWQLQ